MDTSTIKLIGLEKKYGNVAAVNKVDLNIQKGEFLTILGPSGSGKTSLLTLIAGFERPTEGSVLINNKNMVNLPPDKRNIGLVFQSYALFPNMTVFGNVAFPLSIRKYPRDEIKRKVLETLELVHLGDYSNRKITQLSGGQQQRVALARAIVFNPDILLLDEPMAALDRKLRQSVQIELRQLQRSLGITTICVTHDQEEALTMSDRILILNHGQVEQIGTPKELHECPKNRFVAEFLGSANLFYGKVVKHNQVQVIEIEGEIKKECRNEQLIDGNQGTLMVRPEHIRLSPTTKEQNSNLVGRIKSVVYLGTTIRYQIELLSNRTVIATDSQQYQEGELVALDWDKDDSWFINEKSIQTSAHNYQVI